HAQRRFRRTSCRGVPLDESWPLRRKGLKGRTNVKLKVSGYLFVAGCLTLALPFAAQDKYLALTPPMGWNSWNHFAARVDDKAVRTAADAMVASGMKDAGYVYINIDDTWEAKRDTQGLIQPNEKFPDMKSLEIGRAHV